MSPPIPRIARVPLTSKQPEACPHCGGRNVTRRGTRKKKLEIVQHWRCAACKRTFTPGPAALRNKTYPLRMILAALTDYNLGYTLEETATRLKKKTNRRVRLRPSRLGSSNTSSTAVIAGCARQADDAFPSTKPSAPSSSTTGRSTGTPTIGQSSTSSDPERSTTNAVATPTLLASPIFSNRFPPPVRMISSAAMTTLRRGRRRRRQAGLTHPALS